MAGSIESQELDEIRTLAREFAMAELRPNVERWDHERSTGDALRAHLADLGFYGMAISERFGGMDLATPSNIAIIEELAAGEAAVALMLVFHAIAARLIVGHGTDAQRTAWLERMATGDALACIAIAEEDTANSPAPAHVDATYSRADSAMRTVTAGSIAAPATTASRVADGFTITGSKRWVSNAPDATFALVLANLDDARALFIVGMATDGVIIGTRDDTLGLRAMPINTVTFDNVAVSNDALLGGPSSATESATDQLQSIASFEQLAVAAIGTGIARTALEHATRYANEREQFGQPLRMFDGIKFKLADMATRTAAAAALLREAAHSGDAQQARLAKLCATTTAMDVSTQAVQVYGGYGYMRDYPVEKLMRDAKGMEILGGANETLRVAVADALYGT